MAKYLADLDYDRVWGAQLGFGDDTGGYTEDSRCWFDLSIVSRHGRWAADELKLANRPTYQDLIFQGLGLRFSGQATRYCRRVARPCPTISGGVCGSPVCVGSMPGCGESLDTKPRKQAQLYFPQVKGSLVRFWDKALFHLEGNR